MREAHAIHRSASGRRTYTGSTRSAGPEVARQRRVQRRHAGCGGGSRRRGTSAPRATSRSRYRRAPLAHAHGARRGDDVLGTNGRWAGDEDLTATRVDHGEGALGAGSESVERRDPRDLDVPSARPRPRATESPIRIPVKLPGPGADDDPRQIGRDEPCLAEELVDVGEEQSRTRHPLAEHDAVRHEGARGEVSRGIECQDQHARAPRAAFPSAPSAEMRRSSRADVLQSERDRGRWESSMSCFRPFDERNRTVEVRLEIAPLGVARAR